MKVHDENTDIYRVIKSLDREITRMNNEEGTILDVQILSMLIYHQNNDEYGNAYIPLKAIRKYEVSDL